MVTDHAHVLAFNRKTGQAVDSEMETTAKATASTVAPLVWASWSETGVSCGEEGLRGLLDAYEMFHGKRAWRFYTIRREASRLGNMDWSGAGAWLRNYLDDRIL